MPSAELFADARERIKVRCVPARSEEVAPDGDAKLEFEAVECRARLREVIVAMHGIVEREECMEDAGIEVLEDRAAEEMFVEFLKIADAIVRRVPESHKRGEQRYGIGHNA